MATVSRKLPQSNLSREIAIRQAHNKMTLVNPADMPLLANTQTRLTAMNTDYANALNAVALAQANLSTNTPQKDEAIARVRTFVSHFIQVFNLGVAREKYPAAHRAFYMLDVNSNALPDLNAENSVLLWSNRLEEGDANRIAAGGLPMANPEISEVAAERLATLTLFNAQSTLADALDTAQEALELLNEEADKLIKRVWDEVETFYGEEPTESMRENARQWGVVYITKGPDAVLTGLVKNPAGTPLAGQTVTLVQSGATATTNAEGRYEISTKTVGSVMLRVTAGAPPVNYDITAEIPEDHDGITITVADIVVG
jgi:hypothetical protein